METKKYISPGGWFSLEYPSRWNEFEDEKCSFLFYDPETWSGNFRISAFKDSSVDFAEQCMVDELNSNSLSSSVRIKDKKCVYSCERFTEKGESYDSHFWVTGSGDVSIECSFTVKAGESKEAAESIIASLVLRPDNERLPMEVIPIRILEINMVNEAYDWAVSVIKEKLKKDFTSSCQDIVSLQKMIDDGHFKSDQKDCWSSLGIVFGTIIVNEMDGMDWVTVVDGEKEYPALRFNDTSVMVYPTELIWEKIHQGIKCDLKCEFESIYHQVEEVL